MKKIICGLLLFYTFTTGQAQSFDELILKRRYVSCEDVSYQAPELIQTMWANHQLDSLYNFLDYWENKCGPWPYIQAVRTVLDINTANFDPSILNDEFITALIYYKESPIGERNREYIQLHKKLQKQIREMASAVQQTYSVDEDLLQHFFAADTTTFHKIKQTPPAESRLRQLYDKHLNEALRIPEFNFSLFAGYYHPFGKLSVFGPHPSIGMAFGVQKIRHSFDLVFDVRLGGSKEKYEFVYRKNLMEDDKWTSVYFGLEYTYDFLIHKKFRMGLSPGVAYNGITAVPADDNDDNAKILRGLDVSGGLALKYLFGKRGAYAGLQTRIHWVDHRNPGGTELYGNYLSVRLTFGRVFNQYRNYRLKQLD